MLLSRIIRTGSNTKAAERRTRKILKFERFYGVGAFKLFWTFLQTARPRLLCNELYFHKEIVIERKNSLEELSGNLGKGRERFEKEFLKARNNGCSIHLMVENPQGLNDIMKHNYNTQLKPTSYMASLKSFEQRYDLKMQFIDPQHSGYNIYSTFYYYMRNKLHQDSKKYKKLCQSLKKIIVPPHTKKTGLVFLGETGGLTRQSRFLSRAREGGG